MSEDAHPDVLGGNAQSQLKGIVERANRLIDDRDAVNADLREVFGEAKAFGLNPKLVRKAVAETRKDQAKRLEEDAILDLYLSAILG